MKPTFKTTALAILVSLGVAACSSSSKDDFNPNMIKEKAEKKANDVVEQAKDSAEAKAKEAEKAEAEKKATELKEKQEAEAKAKAKEAEAEKARLEAEQKAKAEAELKAKQEAEKVLAKEKEDNKWRGSESGATVYSPGIGRHYHWARQYESSYDYVDGYNGIKDEVPVHNSANDVNKIDYYKLSVEDKDNPQLLGWHKGVIESDGIVGSEISKLNENNEIVERIYPKKVNYIFKNTPYSTYGAVYNNEAFYLFASYEKGSSLDGYDTYSEYDTYQVGEVIDNQTSDIKYNDTVKGAATYKGDVLAHVKRVAKIDGYAHYYLNEKTPEVDGSITINANFGPSAAENFASATLESKALGKVEFDKTQMDLLGEIEFNLIHSNYDAMYLKSTVVGKEADEIVGKIEYTNYSLQPKIGDVREYKAVFVADKQAK